MPHREDYSQILGGRPVIGWAIRGNLTNDPTQAGIEGVSKTLELDLPSISRSDGGMEPYNDGHNVLIKVVSMQNTYAAVKRSILRCNSVQTLIARFGTKYYNFIDPYDVGMEVELDVTGDDIQLIHTYSGRVLKDQWPTVLAGATGITAGVTGGVSIAGLTAEAFDNTEYGGSGILACYVGTGTLATDDELGIKEKGGSKFNMKIGKTVETVTYNKPVTKRVEFKNTIALAENTIATESRLDAYTNTEKVITWVFANGLTIVLHNCTKFVNGSKFEDSKGLINLRNEGSTYLDPINGSAINGTPALGTTNIGFVDSTSTIHFYKQGNVL